MLEPFLKSKFAFYFRRFDSVPTVMLSESNVLDESKHRRDVAQRDYLKHNMIYWKRHWILILI